MYAAEGCFFPIDDLSIATLVDLAAAVGADFETGLNGDGDKVGEAFEQASADFFSFLSELENLLFFLTHGLNRVFYQTFFFELLEKRINQAWANFFSYSLFEAGQYAVAVGGSFV